MKKDVSTPVRYLKGIGPQRAASLEKMGVCTIEDLLYHFPRRHEDRTHFVPIMHVKEGETYTIQAVVRARGQRRSFRRRGFSITEIVVADASGKISCVWFNQPYIKNYMKVGTTLILYGKIERYGKRLQMTAPEFEISSDEKESFEMGRIVPIYSLPAGMSQRTFRRLMYAALGEYLVSVREFLPYDIRKRQALLNRVQSIRAIHFPQNANMREAAYRRLAFEEFFLFQLPLAIRKIKKREQKGIAHGPDREMVDSFLRRLPFTLTQGQQKSLEEILKDMTAPFVMQRLLQGDVGSGKTIVATLSALFAVAGGYQVAFMVPTEILAKQHYEKLDAAFKRAESNVGRVRLLMLTGGGAKKEKEKQHRLIREGGCDIIIGTHALLEEKIRFYNLGLVIIDEQHKFGVGQRALLPEKGLHPDVLIMTATPIPRTLAITLYGDLDISVIRELPPGRPSICTRHFSQQQRPQAYRIAQDELDRGHQVYIVYPVIEESYALDMMGAQKLYEHLREEVFQSSAVGLIYGKLSSLEQAELMASFKEGRISVLVATTVIEVGIDIPRATCMIIEHAERFGLAQLHQLRGRIGRGTEESYCLLISDAFTDEAKARINALVTYGDGFRIAEADLKIRGPGEFFGKRQHGLTELKIAQPLLQLRLLQHARSEALRFLTRDPHLQSNDGHGLKRELVRRFPEYEVLMGVV